MTNEYGADLDRNGYAPSIIARTETRCFLCGCSDEKLDRHEVFHGAYRQKSKRLGLWVPLCHSRCHLGGAHKNAQIDLKLKKIAQEAAMNAYGLTTEEFINLFGKIIFRRIKMLNNITIMGRMTRDPELRYTKSETPVASFTLAVDDDFKGADGSKTTQFIDCVAWRNTAEFVSRYFEKGSMAVVSGRLQIRDWTDNNGNKRRAAEVVVDSIYFGESKKSASEAAPTFSDLGDDDGDLPF